MPFCAVVCLVSLLAADAAAPPGPEPPPPGRRRQEALAAAETDPFEGIARLERATLLRAVVQRNPTLEAARQAWLAAGARPAQRESRQDPWVSLSLTPFAPGSGAPFGEVLELRQELVRPARRQLRGASARAEAAAAWSDYRRAMIELVAEASLLYDDYYLIYRSMAINTQHLSLARDLQRLAAARYSSGLAPQQDPLAAEVEATRLLHRQTELEVERELLAIRLQGLVHRGQSLPLPPPPEHLPVPVPAGPLAGEAEELAAAASPEVASLRAAADAGRAELELSRLARRPDLELVGSYDARWARGGQRVLAGVSVGLPVRTERLEAARTEAEASLARVESERAAAEDRVRAAARSAAVQLEVAPHMRDIYQDQLLPASRDQLQAARAGFEAGHGSLDTVLAAERNLRDVELGSEEALVDVYRRQTELDRVLGRLPPGAGLPDLPAAPPSSGASATRSPAPAPAPGSPP